MKACFRAREHAICVPPTKSKQYSLANKLLVPKACVVQEPLHFCRLAQVLQQLSQRGALTISSGHVLGEDCTDGRNSLQELDHGVPWFVCLQPLQDVEAAVTGQGVSHHHFLDDGLLLAKRACALARKERAPCCSRRGLVDDRKLSHYQAKPLGTLGVLVPEALLVDHTYMGGVQ